MTVKQYANQYANQEELHSINAAAARADEGRRLMAGVDTCAAQRVLLNNIFNGGQGRTCEAVGLQLAALQHTRYVHSAPLLPPARHARMYISIQLPCHGACCAIMLSSHSRNRAGRE